jgi:UDPglucose 6-dehydrogenase
MQDKGKLPRLSIIGLGKLGSPMVAVFASKGFDVIGVDLNTAFVDALNAGKAPVQEPRLRNTSTRRRAESERRPAMKRRLSGAI